MSLILAVPPRCSVTSERPAPSLDLSVPIHSIRAVALTAILSYPKGWGPAPSVDFRDIASKNNSP